MKIRGLDSLQKRFVEMKLRVKRTNNPVIVGYTQAYAIYVHENLEAKHAPGKQAKYLEQPAREHSREIANIIATTYKETKDLGLSMLRGALYLLRMSQALVPIDTGALRASGYVAYEKDGVRAKAESQQRAQAKRPPT